MSGTVDNSGPNSRVIEVMNFLAAHPTESFSLSEIATRLGLSNGSAHRLLTTLAEARYLTRHPKHKTYSLGMVMVAIGQAALAQHRDVDVVRQEVARVADDLRVQCLASAIANDEMLVIACEGVPKSFEPPNRVGERRPFVPPLGMGFVAWADEKAQQDYLARAPAALSDGAHERLARGLELYRERGYGMAGDGPVHRALKQFTSRPVGYQGEESYWAGLMQLVGDLSEREIQIVDTAEAMSGGVAYITAPVFSSRGDVAYEMYINGLSPSMSAAELDRHVERLREAAAVATNQIHGRPPWIGGEAAMEPASKGRKGKAIPSS